MPPKVVTLRSELKRAIGDFLIDAEMSCAQTEESLIALAVRIVDYREEGRPLFPLVMICDDLAGVMRNVQGGVPVELGSGSRTPDTVLRALKKCGPLAGKSWAIWVERRTDAFRFGVFRAPMPTALDLRATLVTTPVEQTEPLRAVLIGQAGPGAVELISTGRAGIRIHLSGEREELIQDANGQRQIVAWSASDIEDERVRESYVNFADGVLHDLLRKGHGALIAVVPKDSTGWQEHARDSVILKEPVDLAGQLASHLKDPTSEALADLLASVDLVEGMLSSDGITVFDTGGRVVAFNWFIQTDTASLTDRERLGGARHRAFAALTSQIDQGLARGAFIRSSDGAERAYGRDAND